MVLRKLPARAALPILAIAVASCGPTTPAAGPGAGVPAGRVNPVAGGGGGTSTGSGTGVPTPPPVTMPAPTPMPSGVPGGTSPTPAPVRRTVSQPNIPYPYPTPTVPPVGPGEVVGQVLFAGQPIAGIPVTVTSNNTWHTVNCTTDANGVFRASNLADGDYFAEYYNDSHNDKIGFWKTLTKHVDGTGGVFFPAFDVQEVGMKNVPAEGGSAALPFDFQWNPPQPIIKNYRFRIHDAGGPGGKPYYISDLLPASASDFVYDGTVNQSNMPSTNGKLAPGHYLWGVWWDAGEIGEGGNLYQDFTVTSD